MKGRPAGHTHYDVGDAHLAHAHEPFMRLAIEEAHKAMHLGEVPIGAVIVAGREVIATGFNQPIHHVDPTAHAEIMAMRRAAEILANYRLTGTTLYVTVEPCLMCAGAIVQARVSTLVYGAAEPKCGGIRSLVRLEDLPVNHHCAIVSGVLETECRKLMQDFFKYRRDDA